MAVRLKYRSAVSLTVQQVEAYKRLAASVIYLALDDLRHAKLSRKALFFLTSPLRKTERELWLSWLGFDDDAFQDLLKNPSYQGQPNRIIAKIEKARARQWSAE